MCVALKRLFLSRGGSRIFLGGGALVSCCSSTPINHIFFFCRIPVVLENRRSSQGGGGVRTPCTLPLDPPLLSSLSCLKGVVSYTQATVPQLHYLSCRFFFLYCASSVLPLPLRDFLSACFHQGMAQWRERSPPTNVTRVEILALTPYVGWVCCWFSPLLREVFLRVLPFSPLLKNQHFQIPIRPGIR